MPRGDGTGPWGQGPRTGQCAGRGAGGGKSMGRGMGKGGSGTGPSAYWVCPECGTRTDHRPGMGCAQQKCPQCGSIMARA